MLWRFVAFISLAELAILSAIVTISSTPEMHLKKLHYGLETRPASVCILYLNLMICGLDMITSSSFSPNVQLRPSQKV